MQPTNPDEYGKMDQGLTFRADVGRYTEKELRANADPSCKRCNGTGREGFIEGVAIVCRCVKSGLFAQSSMDKNLEALAESKELKAFKYETVNPGDLIDPKEKP